MYVCMCVCMHERMYICIYVCMYICMRICMCVFKYGLNFVFNLMKKRRNIGVVVWYKDSVWMLNMHVTCLKCVRLIIFGSRCMQYIHVRMV